MASGEPSVRPRGLHHAGVVVSDLDASADFYREMFGAAVSVRVDEEAFSLVMLDLGNAFVELLVFRPRVPGAPLPAGNAVGAGHVALLVEDIAGAHERLRARGVRFEGPPRRVESGPTAGHVIAFCLDPDGNRIELIEAP
jgi:catechol 2,3-dioxygenase-like lactoylglutathione lyase family enzyme